MHIFALFCAAGLGLSGYSEKEIVAATLVLEAGGEKDKRAMPAVLEVIRNRADDRNLTAKAVCLPPKQCSCWNDNPKEKMQKAKMHPEWNRALSLQTSKPTFYTLGANHYCHIKSFPTWNVKATSTVTIENHKFYKLR